MSAFIRRQPGAAGTRTPLDLGTRPGLHGQVLISTGLAGLDRLLGGGLPLGSILLLLEDSNTQQHLNLMKCFMAEGICCKHSVAWVTAQQLTPESTAAFLPDQARSGGSSSSSGQVGHLNTDDCACIMCDTHMHADSVIMHAVHSHSGPLFDCIDQATRYVHE